MEIKFALRSRPPEEIQMPKPRHRKPQASRRIAAAGMVAVLAGGLFSAGIIAPASAADGTSAATEAGEVTITEVRSPYSGIDGGYSAWVVGSGFDESSVVLVNGQPAESWEAIEGQEVGFTMPAGTPGQLVEIQVVTGNGPASNALPFRYASPPGPSVASILPASGSELGGEWITATGTGFLGCETVLIGGIESKGWATAGSGGTEMTFRTPAHAPGIVDVVVQACDDWVEDSNPTPFAFEEAAVVGTHWAYSTPTVQIDTAAAGASAVYRDAILTGAWNLVDGEVEQGSTACLHPGAPLIYGHSTVDGGVIPAPYALPSLAHIVLIATPPVSGERYTVDLQGIPCADELGLTGRAWFSGTDPDTTVLDRGEGRPAGSGRYGELSDTGSISVWDFSAPEAGAYWTGANTGVHLWAETSSGTQIPIAVNWQFAGLGQIGAGDLAYTVEQGDTLRIPSTDLRATAIWGASPAGLSPVVAPGLTPVTATDGGTAYEFVGAEPGESVFAYSLVASGFPDYASQAARIIITTIAAPAAPLPELPLPELPQPFLAHTGVDGQPPASFLALLAVLLLAAGTTAIGGATLTRRRR